MNVPNTIVPGVKAGVPGEENTISDAAVTEGPV